MNNLKIFLPYLFGNKKGKSYGFSLPNPIEWATLNFEETLMFHALQNSLQDFFKTLNLHHLKRNEIYHLFSFAEFLSDKQKTILKDVFPNEYQYFYQAKNASVLNISDVQALLDYKIQKLSVIALLKKDRSRPGVLLIRNANGKFVKNNEGNIWSLPILAQSGRGLPFNHSNGRTPLGVYTIDSVMPEANKQHEFGQYRRLIVNFLQTSPNESQLLNYLPETHHKLSWWKQSVVARDLGRSLLRIHGTGRINRNLLTPYFPLVPTSGCLATNEAPLFLTFGQKRRQDQRHLLDQLMITLGLQPSFENESKIHSLLYVVEFDDNLATLRF